MKLRSFLAAVALLFTTSAVAQQYKYATVPGDPMQTRIYTLDNGLKVYLSVNKENPVCKLTSPCEPVRATIQRRPRAWPTTWST